MILVEDATSEIAALLPQRRVETRFVVGVAGRVCSRAGGRVGSRRKVHGGDLEWSVDEGGIAWCESDSSSDCVTNGKAVRSHRHIQVRR